MQAVGGIAARLDACGAEVIKDATIGNDYSPSFGHGAFLEVIITIECWKKDGICGRARDSMGEINAVTNNSPRTPRPGAPIAKAKGSAGAEFTRIDNYVEILTHNLTDLQVAVVRLQDAL
jgi:hypothetical protein